jgi:hypothetical protein
MLQLKKMQRNATEMVKGLSKMEYEERTSQAKFVYARQKMVKRRHYQNFQNNQRI